MNWIYALVWAATVTIPTIPNPPKEWLPLKGIVYVVEPAPGFRPQWVSSDSTVRVLLLNQTPMPGWLKEARVQQVEVRRINATLIPSSVVSLYRAYSPSMGWTDLLTQIGLIWRYYDEAWKKATPVDH